MLSPSKPTFLVPKTKEPSFSSPEFNWARTHDGYVDTQAEDKDGNNILMVAVKTGNLTLLNELCIEHGQPFWVGRKKNKLNQTAMDIAKQFGRKDILDRLYEYAVKEEDEHTHEYGHLPQYKELEETDFISCDNDLNPLGRKLMLDELRKRCKRPEATVMYVDDKDELIKKIKEFIQSQDDEWFIQMIRDNDGSEHSYIVKLQKFKNKTHIICLDSLRKGYEPPQQELAVLMRHKLPEDIRGKLVYYENSTNQQTKNDCHFAAAINLEKLLLTPDFLQQIRRNKVTKQFALGDIEAYQYPLPASFLEIATSPRVIEQFIRENKSEDLTRVWDGRTGSYKTFMEFVFQTRTRDGEIVSPKPVPNKNYQKSNLTNPDDAKFMHVKKNLTLQVFRADIIYTLKERLEQELETEAKSDASQASATDTSKKRKREEEMNAPDQSPARKKLRGKLSAVDATNLALNKYNELVTLDKLVKKPEDDLTFAEEYERYQNANLREKPKPKPETDLFEHSFASRSFTDRMKFFVPKYIKPERNKNKATGMML